MFIVIKIIIVAILLLFIVREAISRLSNVFKKLSIGALVVACGVITILAHDWKQLMLFLGTYVIIPTLGSLTSLIFLPFLVWIKKLKIDFRIAALILGFLYSITSIILYITIIQRYFPEYRIITFAILFASHLLFDVQRIAIKNKQEQIFEIYSTLGDIFFLLAYAAYMVKYLLYF
jgi:hypothetical protein